MKGAGKGLLRGHIIDAQGVQHLIQLSKWVVPGLERNLFSVKRDVALPVGAPIAGTPNGDKLREQPVSLGGGSPAGGVPQGGVLEHPEQPTSSGGEPVEAPLAGQHHGPLRHQVTPAVVRAGNAGRSLRERSGNDSSHLMKIATDSMLPKLQRPGLHTKAFLPDIAHQTHEAESVAEYPCAMTIVQSYSAGEETEYVQNTFKKVMALSAKAYGTGRWPQTKMLQA